MSLVNPVRKKGGQAAGLVVEGGGGGGGEQGGGQGGGGGEKKKREKEGCSWAGEKEIGTRRRILGVTGRVNIDRSIVRSAKK